ncbi:MAG: 2Fe-2S iron-sulfur cluster binding domain-containing protein [Treponema sp.]|jgi:carbon-monoxide dehydrogenase small subunit|nr:2Fe-2S iron-sulfur cluster binding domain-containing protein [Treponema sp.]
MKLNLTVNGQQKEWDISPDEVLADTLRRYGFSSVKTACHNGACGSCTVFVDGRPMLSCVFLSARAGGRDITTIEGVREEAEKVSECLVRAGGEGCGYCAPGFVMQVVALKRELPKAGPEEIRSYLCGNLCRCTGYLTRNEAVKAYLEMD